MTILSNDFSLISLPSKSLFITLHSLTGQIAAIVLENKRQLNESNLSPMKRISPRGTPSRQSEDSKSEKMHFDDYSLRRRMDDSTENSDEHPFCLTWSELTLRLKKNEKVILDKMSGSARAGRVLALMGPSGAGKTSLLNALGNRASYGHVVGTITFGQRAFTTSDLFFVPQFDEVNANMTVYEQIEFVGLMKCCDKRDMHARLLVIILALGLNEKSKTKCSQLSSGELKKVSVGMGMISKPSVLFMDEPTTGLDSASAYTVVKHLVSLAETLNIAVIMTIHQPAEMVFDMLQDLYLLENGTLVYNGPLSFCEKYFFDLGYKRPPQTCAADFFLDLISKPPTDLHPDSTWAMLYMESEMYEIVCKDQIALEFSTPTAPEASYLPEASTRFYHMLTFFCKYYYREKGFYYRRTQCLILMALYIGTLYLRLSQETGYLARYTGALFFSMWAVTVSVVASSGLLARDRRQAVEQVKNVVISPGMYCISQFLVSLPFNFIGALAFQSIFHWLVDLNPNRESYIYGVLITCGHLLLMEAYMLSAVEVLKNAMLCVTFAMIILGYLFLFAGFFVAVVDMPAWIRWICYTTPTKYSFDGYLTQVFKTQNFLVSGVTPTEFLSGEYILDKRYNISGVNSWAMFGTLLAWVAAVRLLHYGLLFYQVHPYIVWTYRRSCTDKHFNRKKLDFEERQFQLQNMVRNCQ
jgi:ABC-type multidrug transport system ATPase subunit/ABC-type multidrug transport system permease subunit